jgi:hypothetical protein
MDSGREPNTAEPFHPYRGDPDWGFLPPSPSYPDSSENAWAVATPHGSH